MSEIKIGIVGLGRLGKNHALNLRNIIGCKLSAACSVIETELIWAKENLGDIELYSDYTQMLVKADIDTVFLVTPTAVHVKQIIQGFEADKHVFCEKPLGINIEKCCAAADKIHQFSQKKIFCMGFVRRFDPAYTFAKKRIDEGVIGEPFMVRSQTADHDDFATFQVKFVKTGGGIFHDMNVHDIDLARWYIGSEIKSVYVTGGSFVHKEFESMNDADNTTASCKFENGKLAVISASRTAFHGHDTRAEIFGTKGIIRIGYTPSVSDVEIIDSDGMRKECVYTFYDRFKEAFRLEAQAFVDCVLEKRKPVITINDALQATIVAEAFTKSFKEKKVVLTSDI